ncbi:MAG: DNA repair protein RadC [Gammaproteobacteria bacterium]|nr:DNA repair protein RadC [Gammaproteobacteria bacterium]
MPISEWPEGERPRDRLLEKGTDALTDAELVAVCIRTGGRQRSAMGLARRLLKEFGDVQGLLDAPVSRLRAYRDLGPAKIAGLKAVLGLAERYSRASLVGRDVFTESGAVLGYLRHQLAGIEREVFACLFLDTRHRLISFEKLFLGSVDRANVYPREVLKRALALNAAAVIFAHNHPSGVAEPSISDIKLTEELSNLLRQIDVRVLDHVVIGRGREVSMAERGLL